MDDNPSEPANFPEPLVLKGLLAALEAITDDDCPLDVAAVGDDPRGTAVTVVGVNCEELPPSDLSSFFLFIVVSTAGGACDIMCGMLGYRAGSIDGIG